MKPPAKLFSATPAGIAAHIIEVEVDATVGLSSFTIVGLADKSVKESKERISSAIKSIGASSPSKQNRRVTVNLAPADLPKAGSAFDCAIAIGYLLASEQMKPFAHTKIVFAGELALDGRLRPITGSLAIAKAARSRGFEKLIVPAENATEAAIIEGVEVFGFSNLREVIAFIEGRQEAMAQPKTDLSALLTDIRHETALTDIAGQAHAKRALEIAAAGGHNVLLFGTPGVGKTMLAKALPSILPPLNEREAIELTEIYSSSGLMEPGAPIVMRRPFRSPHHSASSPAIIGGGTHPRPGEVSLAHHGVLFLDELPEFRSDVLESLRQPLEEGSVTISRAKQSLTLPAQFIFAASMNPCPCGYFGDDKKECLCTSSEVARYQKKISGPLLDRIDMHIQVPRVESDKILKSDGDPVELARIQQRVMDARERQRERLAPVGKYINSQMNSKETKAHAAASPDAVSILKKAADQNLISVRGFYKILKVARTIADLESAPIVAPSHTAEALQYRMRDFN